MTNFHRPETAPRGEWVLAWIHLPKNPPASMWSLAQRCWDDKDEDPEQFKSAPHLRMMAGCWWNGARYVEPQDIRCWTPLPVPPADR